MCHEKSDKTARLIAGPYVRLLLLFSPAGSGFGFDGALPSPPFRREGAAGNKKWGEGGGRRRSSSKQRKCDESVVGGGGDGTGGPPDRPSALGRRGLLAKMRSGRAEQQQRREMYKAPPSKQNGMAPEGRGKPTKGGGRKSWLEGERKKEGTSMPAAPSAAPQPPDRPLRLGPAVCLWRRLTLLFSLLLLLFLSDDTRTDGSVGTEDVNRTLSVLLLLLCPAGGAVSDVFLSVLRLSLFVVAVVTCQLEPNNFSPDEHQLIEAFACKGKMCCYVVHLWQQTPHRLCALLGDDVWWLLPPPKSYYA
ncbi:hypothetical protein niasHS_001016 [Heterodera schachtii]|uniref:Uncharacterized protein n=1 Tax=Heterodera schachtii TaxID=97005 RepID=A0ABD2K849_HETSC